MVELRTEISVSLQKKKTYKVFVVPCSTGAMSSPVICLEPLEAKGIGADDLSDGVQSMDVRLAKTSSNLFYVILKRKCKHTNYN